MRVRYDNRAWVAIRGSLLTLGVLLGLVSLVGTARADTVTYSGSLTGATPSFTSAPTPESDPCGPVNNVLSGNIHYHAQAFTVGATGTYEITNLANSFQNQDSVFLLYSPSFDPNTPTMNLIAGNDDAIASRAALSCNLTAGTPYVLVTTPFFIDDTGTFTNQISGPGTVTLGAPPAGTTTSTPTGTGVPTATPTVTATPTSQSTATGVPTAAPTATSVVPLTPTSVPPPSQVATLTVTPTATATPPSPASATPVTPTTEVPTNTGTPTSTATGGPTQTSTAIQTGTLSPTATGTVATAGPTSSATTAASATATLATSPTSNPTGTTTSPPTATGNPTGTATAAPATPTRTVAPILPGVGGRQFRLSDQGGGTIGFTWATGTGQTGYRVTRSTNAGNQVVATPGASATTAIDVLPSTVAVACYQLEILGAGGGTTAVVGRSDALCIIVIAGGGTLPVRNLTVRTDESPAVTISWQAPATGADIATPIGYLVVPLGRNPLPIVPATATQAVDVPGRAQCYMVLTLIPDSALVPFRIGGFSSIACALPGMAT